MKKWIDKIKNGLLKEILAETKWIYTYAARYRWKIVLFIVFGLVSTVLGLAGSVATKYTLDGVFSKQKNIVIFFGVMYIVVGLLRIVVSSIVKRITTKLSVNASNELRADVYKRFLKVDWEASLDYHSGDILTRINSDVSTVADSILGWIPSLFVCGAQFVGALVVTLCYDPIMALIALASVPFTLILSRLFVPRMRTFGKQVREQQARMNSFYEESLSNLQAIKSFHLNDHFNTRLARLQELYKDISLDYNKFSINTNFLMSVLAFGTGGLTLSWGLFRLWRGYITTGSMVLFIQLAGIIASAFSSLIGTFPSIITSTVSAGRLMKILELPTEDYTITDDGARVLQNAEEKGAGITVDRVAFTYKNGRKVFSRLSLSASPGEIIGIVSPSGGGKTTLIRLLLGLISPNKGSITVFSGDDCAAMTPAMRPLFTYVAQEKVVFSGTIAGCLRLTAPGATDDQLKEVLRLACADEFVDTLPDGIHTLLAEKGTRFSDGQIQRLAIARALLSDAPILLLDEATSALDFETERKVVENLVNQNPNRTIIVTTHRPQILNYCTRIYRI